MLSPVKSVAFVSLLAACLLFLSTSHGQEPNPGPMNHFPFAHMEYDCGSMDNVEIQFIFTMNRRRCWDSKEPYLRITIDGNAPKSLPTDYSIESGTSTARRCTIIMKSIDCETAASGTLHITKFSKKGASGDYEVRFKNGTVETSTFDATWCIPWRTMYCP